MIAYLNLYQISKGKKCMSFWYTTSLHSMYFKATICFSCILLPLQSLAVASFLGILKSADFLLSLVCALLLLQKATSVRSYAVLYAFQCQSKVVALVFTFLLHFWTLKCIENCIGANRCCLL
jgi:hypothetical protein